MKIDLKIKPLHAKPIKAVPLVPMKHITTKSSLIQPTKIKGQSIKGESLAVNKTETLPDAGGMREPTREDIIKYQKSRERIVSSIVVGSLRKHKQDVLHGSQSLKRLLPNYNRDPDDYDILSPQEKIRAQQIERAIDRKAGANVVETRYVPIPKVTMGEDEPGTAKELYRVIAPSLRQTEVDVMDKPPGIRTLLHKGIRHEHLREAYVKARRRVKLQPIQAGKAVSDARDIEEYWQAKGIKPPELEEAKPPSIVLKDSRIRKEF